jgi:NAD(P)-dependent dehydrogenase (short-subunit alcohol dehydrogenase family)
MAREHGPLGICANAIGPAMIDTRMLDGQSTNRMQGIFDAGLLKRIGTARELAGACPTRPVQALDCHAIRRQCSETEQVAT